ncbi:site-specific integrase [bacterium]|nr:site-specific integrase [bacterium]
MARSRRGRGEGAVYQRKDGTWCGSVSLGVNAAGRRVRRTVYGETKAAVLRKLDAARNGLLPRAAGVTVGQFVRSWLDGIKTALEPTTWAQYDGHLRNHIDTHLGGVRLAALDAAGVIGFVGRLTRTGVSAATARKVVRTLKAAIAEAVAADILPKNPASRVSLPKHDRPVPRVLTPKEVEKLLASAASHRLGAVFAVAIDSGLRQGELFALTWADYDGTAVMVTKSLAELKGRLWIKAVKTRNARRQVPLAYARPALAAHREAMATEGQDTTAAGLMFPDTEGGFLRKSNFGRRVFHPIVHAAGLTGLRFHDLRHACASLMLVARIDPKVVSSRLGHGSAYFTQDVYQHVIPGVQAAAADTLAGVLSGEIGYTQATNSGNKEPSKRPRKRPKVA